MITFIYPPKNKIKKALEITISPRLLSFREHRKSVGILLDQTIFIKYAEP